MADSLVSYAKRQVSADSVTWTAIVAPISGSGLGLRNSDAANGFKIRTDQNNPATQDSVGAGVSDGFSAAGTRYNYKFKAGDTICYVQTASGVGPIQATFVA